MRKIEYRDTDREWKVNIYGLDFDVNIKEFDNIDTENISKEENLEDIIDKVLGKEASKKINEKRIADGHEEMNSNVALTILAFLTEDYVDRTMQPMNRPLNKYNSYNKRVNNLKRNRYRR